MLWVGIEPRYQKQQVISLLFERTKYINKLIYRILHKQTGEPYGGFCTCTVGLIRYWKKQICLEKKQKNKKQFKTSSLFYRRHTLPDVITLEYPNFENPVD
jgi:hypothetical protein